MKKSPLLDVVANQYARWVYPQPILDIPTWLENNWEWFDPRHAHRMFWPDQDYQSGLDILIAGCGTNQAAIFAYCNPSAKVVAIDVSGPSLDHHRYLKNKYQMDNLELHLLPIEQVSELGRDFDLIVSTGVLHHLADPQVGINALSNCLRPSGVMAIMLYAEFGRIGVEMMQSVFRDLGLGQNDASVLMVRDALQSLPDDHPIKSYIAFAPDLQYDAGLVDTFLNGRERSYSIPECLELVQTAGLVFQDLFLKSPYYPPSLSTSPFHASIACLPAEKQWAIMEKVHFRNACHFFTACRPERGGETYKIDFTQPDAIHYVPSFRHRCGYADFEIFRPNWSMEIDTTQRALLAELDGYKSIKEIVALVYRSDLMNGLSCEGLESFAVAFFERLWKLDFVAIGLRPVAEPRSTARRPTATRINKDKAGV